MSSVGHVQPQHHFPGVIPIFFWAMLACGGMETLVWGHPGHSHSAVKEHDPDEDQDDDEEAMMLGLRLEGDDFPRRLAMLDPKESRPEQKNAPEIARAFEAFVKSRGVQTRWNERFFFVESRGIPDHRMMVGITAWQQQVPLPQPYAGENAWQIPLYPCAANWMNLVVTADEPMTTTITSLLSISRKPSGKGCRSPMPWMVIPSTAMKNPMDQRSKVWIPSMVIRMPTGSIIITPPKPILI